MVKQAKSKNRTDSANNKRPTASSNGLSLGFIAGSVVILAMAIGAAMFLLPNHRMTRGNDEICPRGKTCNMKERLPVGANAEGKPIEAPDDCLDRHKECTGFARQGECVKSPGWMTVNCPRSCNACHLRDPKIRCDRARLNMTLDPVYNPGDVDQLFRGLKSRFDHKYEVNILSESPWVATFDNFLSAKEMTALINSVERWERSTDTGSMNSYGEVGRILSQGRTSSNAWCTRECEKHPDVMSIMQKIEEVTEIPRVNFESFQVLRYELGQKYNTHHDFGQQDVGLACGPRILTFFLYLSDVEEGGETNFPLLDIAVKPKRGRALLWPSVLDSNLEAIDSRTMHEAKPVIRGRKFAANSWIHLYEYAAPNHWGCTGSFDLLG